MPLVTPAKHPRSFSKMVFLCGLHRSGTTMLEHLMRARFQLAGLKAPVPENEGQHLQDVYPAAKEHGGPGRFAFAPIMRMGAPAADADAARERLLSCWSPWVEGDQSVLLEKSPPNLTKIAWLRSVFPGAIFVIMTRDPRAVAAATRKWSSTSIEELVYHWHVAHEATLKDMRADCLKIRYEDMCEAPADILNTIRDFAQLDDRETAKETEARFQDLRSTNASYLEQLEPTRFGTGCWQEFGYDLT